jgi:ferric-dicitrate binding protein FerR (iron transport regulator)
MEGTCSPQEVERFLSLVSSAETDDAVLNHIRLIMSGPGDMLREDTRDRLQKTLEHVLSAAAADESPRRDSPVRLHRRIWRYVAAASVVLIMAGAGIYLLSGVHEPGTGGAASRLVTHDVLPGGNKATLTLANGTTIVLDSAHHEHLPSQGAPAGINITNGLVSYNPLRAGGKIAGSPQYNTLSTPKGGQYQLELADGTKVWLNAASSIRYPTSFEGAAMREVEVSGEAYFEIARKSGQPFRVQVGSMQVDVLGTRFNIEAYADQPTIKTTLLEGGVRVTQGHDSQVLNPGEQSQLSQNGELKLVRDANVEGAVAWKNGYFSFDQADLRTVMLKIARWYNVNVVYQGDIVPQRFGGEIQENLTLSQVLTILGKSQIDFGIAGNTLTIYSNK